MWIPLPAVLLTDFEVSVSPYTAQRYPILGPGQLELGLP
jgi:hypothetical protein